MAVVEEGVITWLSGCSSSLQISIVSALFIIIYVVLYSLCTSCFSESHMCLCRREKTSVLFSQKVPGVTEQYSKNQNGLEHVSMGTSSPQCVGTLALPSPPPDLMANLEPLLQTPSFHALECGNVASRRDEYMPAADDPADHKHSLLETELNEENPYEYISELPSRPQPDTAEESPRPFPVITNLEELRVNNSEINNPVNEQEMEQPHASPHALSDRRLVSTEPTAVYAAVNWKTKCQKNTETVRDTYVEDLDDITGEAAPPIPDKHF